MNTTPRKQVDEAVVPFSERHLPRYEFHKIREEQADNRRAKCFTQGSCEPDTVHERESDSMARDQIDECLMRC